jgi:superfamily I DNA and/or RNA helicase
MNAQMERYFVTKDSFRPAARHCRPFSICVADEASQCVEPEMLIPFRLGFSKLVMVGDPAQLPGKQNL